MKMMAKPHHKFPSLLTTSDANIIKDFFAPALQASVRYDRGVGFFSAGWLRIAAEGMTAFARNSGQATNRFCPVPSQV